MPARRLAAFRIGAAGALVAILEPDQRCLAAFRALPEPWAADTRRPLRLEIHDLGLEGPVGLLRRQESDIDHMALDDVADGGEQGGHVLALHPGTAARVEHRLH